MEHAYYTGLIDELVGKYCADHGNQIHAKDFVSMDNVWVPDQLHCSDLGLCPRSVCLRFTGATKNIRTDQWERNRMRKFLLANTMHNLVYAAVRYAGYEANCEVDITERLPDGWTGRVDLDWIFPTDRIGTDVKSKDPRAMLYAAELPQPYQKLQSGCYDLFYGVDVGWTGFVIAFFDRGGGEDSKEVIIDGPERIDTHAAVRFEVQRLSEFAHVAKTTGVLPDMMPKELRIRDRSKSIKLEPFWQCSAEYCDYYVATCLPDTSRNLVAKRPDEYHPWELTDFGRSLYHGGYGGAIDEFLASAGYQLAFGT